MYLRRSWLLVPTMVLLCLVACNRRPSGRVAYVDLPAVDNLEEGTPVRFGGVDIGVLQHVALRRDGITATLLIQRPDAPIHANDLVAVRPVGIFGAHALDIIPVPSEARPLRSGDTLHAAPPDSLAPVREALMRAVVHEFADRLRQSDTTKQRNRSP